MYHSCAPQGLFQRGCVPPQGNYAPMWTLGLPLPWLWVTPQPPRGMRTYVGAASLSLKRTPSQATGNGGCSRLVSLVFQILLLPAGPLGDPPTGLTCAGFAKRPLRPPTDSLTPYFASASEACSHPTSLCPEHPMHCWVPRWAPRSQLPVLSTQQPANHLPPVPTLRHAHAPVGL